MDVAQLVGVIRGLSRGGVGEGWGLSFSGEVACNVGVSPGSTLVIEEEQHSGNPGSVYTRTKLTYMFP